MTSFAHTWSSLHLTSRFLAGIALAGLAGSFLIFLWATSRALSVELPAQGGEFSEAVVGDVRFINPLLASLPAERDVTSLVYGGLTRLSADGAYHPDLAQTITQTQTDPPVFRVVLRQDARFQDDTPLTSNDVAFTFRLAQDPAFSPLLAGRYSGVRVSVEDERTLTFTFPPSQGPRAMELLSLGILPQHIWESASAETFPLHPANTSPVGAGPYRLANITRDESGKATEVLLRSWQKGPHAPKLTSVRFSLVANADAALALMRDKAVDATAALRPKDYAALPSSVAERYALLTRPTDRVFALFYNYNQEPALKKVAARRALDVLIDRHELIAHILPGEAWVATGPLPPSAPLPATTTPREERIARATKLLLAAGWTQDDNGKWHATKTDPEPVELIIRTGSQEPLPQIAQFVAQQWEAAGINAHVETFDTGLLATEVIRPRLFEVLLFGMVVGKEGDIYPFWHSSQRSDPGVNVAQYANIEVDAALEKLRAATSSAERAEIINRVTTIINEEVPASFLFTPLFSYIVSKDIRNVVLPPIMSSPEERFASLAEWYRETERLWKPVAALLGAQEREEAGEE